MFTKIVGSTVFVLPASAGMILAYHMYHLSCLCAPRIRGDDPGMVLLSYGTLGCSPHPRG